MSRPPVKDGWHGQYILGSELETGANDEQIPGLSNMMGQMNDDEGMPASYFTLPIHALTSHSGSMKLKRMMIICDSMTAKELDSDGKIFVEQPTRITRVARGSGTSVREVEELLSQTQMMAGMAKKMGGNMKKMQAAQKNPAMAGQMQQMQQRLKAMQGQGGGGGMPGMGGMGGMPDMGSLMKVRCNLMVFSMSRCLLVTDDGRRWWWRRNAQHGRYAEDDATNGHGWDAWYGWWEEIEHESCLYLVSRAQRRRWRRNIPEGHLGIISALGTFMTCGIG